MTCGVTNNKYTFLNTHTCTQTRVSFFQQEKHEQKNKIRKKKEKRKIDKQKIG